MRRPSGLPLAPPRLSTLRVCFLSPGLVWVHLAAQPRVASERPGLAVRCCPARLPTPRTGPGFPLHRPGALSRPAGHRGTGVTLRVCARAGQGPRGPADPVWVRAHSAPNAPPPCCQPRPQGALHVLLQCVTLVEPSKSVLVLPGQLMQ